MSGFYEFTVRVEEMASSHGRRFAVDVPAADPNDIGITLTGPNLERLLRMAVGGIADSVLLPELGQ